MENMENELKEIEEIEEKEIITEEDIDESDTENKKYDESRIYYVYEHIRLDKMEPFYIGKGKGERAYDLYRNDHHDAITDEYGHAVVIIADNLTEEEAYWVERDTIEDYVFNLGYGIDIKGHNDYNHELPHLTNMDWGGIGGKSGVKHSDEAKQKMSESHRRENLSEETIQRMSESHKGIKQSEESKRKISEKMTGENHPMYGKHHSKETKENISEKLKGKMTGENHPFYGKHHSKETKENISEKLKGENNPMYGKHRSEETKIKMSEAKKGENNPMYGKHHTEEYKKNMSEKMTGENHPMYGKHHSKETIEKLSKKVICITTGETFDSIKDASDHYKVAKSSICDCCKGKRKHAGELNGIKLQWKYADDDNESKAV